MTFFHIILIVIILKLNGENKIALYSFQGDNKKLSYKKKTVFNRFVFKLIHSSFKNQNTYMNKSILTRACRTFFLTNCFFTVIINCFKIMIIHVYFVNLHFAFQKFCSRLSFIIGIHLIVFRLPLECRYMIIRDEWKQVFIALKITKKVQNFYKRD